MAFISIDLDNELIREIKINSKKMRLSQTQYIQLAIKKMNDEMNKEEWAANLQEVSKRVRIESMKINQEFADMESSRKFRQPFIELNSIKKFF